MPDPFRSGPGYGHWGAHSQGQNRWGRPQGWGRRHFRRRLLWIALGVWLLWIGLGIVFGAMAGDERDKPWGDGRGGDRNPLGLVAVVGGVALIGGVATALAYRRLSRPVGDLLDAADKVAQGDYDVAVRPQGPRELRQFAGTFNSMAEQLALTDEQRRRFLADVTHELRTPLSVLQGGIAAQLDGIHPRDDRHLQSLLEETERIGHLIEDLHTMALADAGRLVLHAEPTSLAALVSDALAAHTTLAERKGLQLRSSVAEGLPALDIDPVRIRQVLDNLLSNAVRHTPADGEVTVSVASTAEAEAEAVEVIVSDTGPGFPPERLGHVFDRFTRAADTSGSGLGLSIAQDLIHAHSGTIHARNLDAGGASVRFTLPTHSSLPRQ